jgi:hypothetical protein
MTLEGHISMKVRPGVTVNLPDDKALDAIGEGWAVAYVEPVAPQEKAVAAPKERKLKDAE